jgi:hypothetical protein
LGLIQRSEAAEISSAEAAVAVKLTLGNIDFSAALLGMTGTASLYLILAKKTNFFARILFLLSFYQHYILLFDSPAKQGRVIFLAGIVLIFGFWLSTNSSKIFQRIGIIWWLFTLIIFVLSIASLFNFGPLKHLFDDDRGSIEDRKYPFIGALRMIRSDPFFGVGIESFGDWYPRFNSTEGYERIIAAGGAPIDNPHNVFLNFGATGGILLLFIYIVFNIFVLSQSIKTIIRNSNTFLNSGLLVIWLLFQAQSLISIDQIGLTCWGWAFSGCIVSMSYMDSKQVSNINTGKSFNRKINFQLTKHRILIPLIIICQIPSFYMALIASNHIKLGNRVDELRTTVIQEKVKINAAKLFETSIKNQDPFYRANIVRLLVQFNENEFALKLAIDSTKKFPLDFESWNTLARFYEVTGQKSMAIEARKKTIELNPLNLNLKAILEDNISG